MIFLFLLMILAFFGVLVSFFLFYKTNVKLCYIICGVGASFFLFFLWKFMSLRYFSYENSGEVISIKYSHPLFVSKTSRPVLEFPIEKLSSFKIEQSVFTDKQLKIKVKNSKDRIIAFKYTLQNFPQSKLSRLNKSVQVYHFAV